MAKTAPVGNSADAVRTLQALRGPDRVAILFLTLGEDEAGRLLAALPRKEAEAVLGAMSRLGRVDDKTADAVRLEFKELVAKQNSATLMGDGAAARRLLGKAFGNSSDETRQALIAGISDDGGKEVADAVENIPPLALGRYLGEEHPQTGALVLAHASPKHAAAVLKALPAPLRTEILTRIAAQNPVAPETLADLAETLRDLAAKNTAATQSLKGGAARVAAMLATLSAAARDLELEAIEARDPQLAAEIAALMFVFKDVVRITDRGLQTLLGQIPEADLKMALKGAPDTAEAFFRNMSERRAVQLKEELASGPKVKRSDVETAQRKIAAVARQLLDAGKIELADGEEMVA